MTKKSITINNKEIMKLLKELLKNFGKLSLQIGRASCRERV